MNLYIFSRNEGAGGEGGGGGGQRPFENSSILLCKLLYDH